MKKFIVACRYYVHLSTGSLKEAKEELRTANQFCLRSYTRHAVYKKLKIRKNK